MFETSNQMSMRDTFFQETYQNATISRKITHGIEWIVISLRLERNGQNGEKKHQLRRIKKHLVKAAKMDI